MQLSDYKIEKRFSSANAMCIIATSKLDDKRYFLKKITEVTYGSPSDPTELREHYKAEADSWLAYHRNVCREFLKHSEGHGNIIFPIAYFVDEGSIYEVQHFVEINKLAVSDNDEVREGVTSVNKRVRDLQLDDKLMLLMSSAYALTQVHSWGFIHCDLKPDNVPICTSSMNSLIAKITDCGDAIFANDVPSEDYIVCTEPYWSPELYEYKMGDEDYRSRVSSKNDVFAMGIIFHEWWTGDFPYYDGRDDGVYPYQIVESSWPNGITIDRSVPQWLAGLILDMLHPDPDKRPTMQQVHTAVRQREWQHSVPVRPDLTRLKNALSAIPSDASKFTKESYSKLIAAKKWVNENATEIANGPQAQIDDITNKLEGLIRNLVPVQDETPPRDSIHFEKIKQAVGKISSHDFSPFTAESKNKLFYLIEYARQHRSELQSESAANDFLNRLAYVYQHLERINPFDDTNVPYDIANPIPQPFTDVKFISNEYILAHYGEGGKIRLSVENAANMGLIKKRN